MATTKQLSKHMTNITGSQMPAICRCSPYPGALYQIWARLTGRIGMDDISSPRMDFGNFAEKFLADRFTAATGIGVRHRGLERRIDEAPAPMIVHCDRLTDETDPCPISFKTTGIYGRIYQPDAWGEPGTDQIPEWAYIQLMTEMIATRAPIGWCTVLIGGRGDATYRVPYDQGLADMMMSQVEDFWVNNVQADIPPDIDIPPLEVVKRFKRDASKVYSLPAGVGESFLDARQKRIDADKAEKDLQAVMLAEMDDASIGQLPDGTRIEYREIHRKGYTVKGGTSRRILVTNKENTDE